MNEFARVPPRPTTRAAEGWPRISWTHADLDRMVESGLLTASDRVELVGGEIIPMSPKGNRHERVRRAITKCFYQSLAGDKDLLAEPGWRPTPESYLEPDILIVPSRVAGMEFAGSEVLLAVEIAETSLGYDTTIKRDAYARLGVREYWVIDARALTTRVFTAPHAAGYDNDVTHAAGVRIAPGLVPEIAVCLAALGVEG